MTPTSGSTNWFRGAPWLAITIVVVAIMGLALAGGGAWLAALGGSVYYLIAGAMLLLTSWLLAIRRAEALLVYAALLLGTMMWAIWEVGLDFWTLAPRGDVLAPLGAWLMLPFIASHLGPRWRIARRALGVVLIAAAIVLGVSLTSDRHDLTGKLAENETAGAPTAPEPAEAPAAGNWTAYGGSGFGTRYSSLREITADNVKNLKLAWEFRTGDHKGPDDPGEITNQATPLKVGDLLYTC
jgi:quinoprotein glucose dehydrogenase